MSELPNVGVQALGQVAQGSMGDLTFKIQTINETKNALLSTIKNVEEDYQKQKDKIEDYFGSNDSKTAYNPFNLTGYNVDGTTYAVSMNLKQMAKELALKKVEAAQELSLANLNALEEDLVQEGKSYETQLAIYQNIEESATSARDKKKINVTVV